MRWQMQCLFCCLFFTAHSSKRKFCSHRCQMRYFRRQQKISAMLDKLEKQQKDNSNAVSSTDFNSHCFVRNLVNSKLIDDYGVTIFVRGAVFAQKPAISSSQAQTCDGFATARGIFGDKEASKMVETLEGKAPKVQLGQDDANSSCCPLDVPLKPELAPEEAS